MHILLVEDSVELLAAMVELFEEMGCEVAGVSNFKEADARLKSAPWDFLLTDFLIGSNENGIDLYYDAIKRGASGIIMSGSEEVYSLCEENNIPFLAKPFSSSKLMAMFGLSCACEHVG